MVWYNFSDIVKEWHTLSRVDRKRIHPLQWAHMRYSLLFGKTLREVPQDIRFQAHALLIKGGFIRSLGQGLFSLLPLGKRVMDNLTAILREEMQGLGGQEVEIPMVNPYDIWKKSGRDEVVDKELIRFKDRAGKDLVLSPTHEEAMVELVRLSINSYRDLPVFLFEFQDKFRDEERTRCGLVRSKEFLMKDAYSFHRTFSDLNNFFPKIFAAYQRIFRRCGVPFVEAEAGVGYIGGHKAYEFLMPSEHGDDTVIVCDSCGYTANSEIALGVKEFTSEPPLNLEKIETPDCQTMEKLSAFLNLPKLRLGKSIVYKTPMGLVMAVVRADYDVSLEKLTKVFGQPVLRLATREELLGVGIIPGYVSPILEESVMPVIVDDTIANSTNLVYGGNEEGFHYLNGNFGRDFETEYVADIALMKGNAGCIHCGKPLKEVRAIELGNIFKLGDRYTRTLDLSFQDDGGNQVYPQMGSYGIGMGRLLACIVESNHDDKGIIWPLHIAPFKAFLMSIGKSFMVKKMVGEIHDFLGDTVLYDDRDESPGVKFKDADLIGIPFRIIVSSKLLEQGKIEIRERRSGMQWFVDADKIFDELHAIPQLQKVPKESHENRI